MEDSCKMFLWVMPTSGTNHFSRVPFVKPYSPGVAAMEVGFSDSFQKLLKGVQ